MDLQCHMSYAIFGEREVDLSKSKYVSCIFIGNLCTINASLQSVLLHYFAYKSSIQLSKPFPEWTMAAFQVEM